MSFPLLFLILAAAILPAHSQNWIAEGNRALDSGRPREAITLLRSAISEASGGVLPLQISLATAYFDAGEYRLAEDVLKHAEKPTSGTVAHAELLNAWGGLHLVQSRLTEAERELSEALRIIRQQPERQDLLPVVLNNLSGVETRMGRYAEGLNHGLEAVRLWQETLSPNHPDLIKGRGSLATIQYLKGRFQEAHELMKTAIGSAEITYGAEDRTVADMLISDALVLDKLKRKKEAKAARQRAQQIRAGYAPATPDGAMWNVKEAILPDSRVALLTK